MICGDRDLDLSESSDDDNESLDSFRSEKSETKARNWAYCILICYTIAAISFMVIFILWFTTNKKNENPVTALEVDEDF